MNKTAIKNFSIWARNKLIADVCYRAGLAGITEDGIQPALPQSDGATEFYDIGTAKPYSISGPAIRQRRNLAEAIRRRERTSDYPTAYRCIMEEVAYTWFNRLIAVRFMEVNDYLPGRVRVLSSESGKVEPDLVTTPFDADLTFTADEEELVCQMQRDNQTDRLFRLLFIKQCNALSAVLPALFEQYNDYTEMLLNLSIVDQDGVVWHLVHDIPEEDFNVEKGGQVEIIGWLYQYYNIEPKAQVFARPSGQKIRKEDIPAATQLFTPDWIVRYMVENSLGRLWLEGHPDEELQAGWKYYLEEAEQEPEVLAQLEEIRAERRMLNPEDIRMIDPCMGSGHILVYAFDALMQIYEKAGWDRREAVRSIVEKNLYGLDIDYRAFQLAYFAVMMKARQYDRRFLSRGIQPQVYYSGGDRELEEFGSLLIVEKWEKPETEQVSTFDVQENYRRLLAGKYDVVVTNPPYMAISNASEKMQKYIKKNFPDSKTDLFAAFIERCAQFTKENGYQAMITQHAWMFLSSFEKLRTKTLESNIVNLAHLGIGTFEDLNSKVVQSVAFIIRKSYIISYIGCYNRLFEKHGLTESNLEKQTWLIEGKHRFFVPQSNFSKIPGSPIAYWASERCIAAFEKGILLREIAVSRVGLQTSNNDYFLRMWFEVNNTNIFLQCQSFEESKNSDLKWYPHNKGGAFRKWYGNHEYVINYQYGGRELSTTNGAAVIPKDYAFQSAITYSRITSGLPSFRYQPVSFIFDSASVSSFAKQEIQLYLLGLLNTKIIRCYLNILAPTLNTQPGDIAKMPIIICAEKAIVEYVKRNIYISKKDWDSFETSWNFTRHPLVRSLATVAEAYAAWEDECSERFSQLKANEEELNRIFIGIYGLQDELTPEVEDKDVTVRRADLGRDIRSLLSYAVGCMFGRYSLDVEGLAYAGGEWAAGKYSSFHPNTDNIIPLTDEAYLENDIITRLCQWLRVVYGPDTLEENLDFIAKALGNKGMTSREIIRNYFLKDFFSDHCKIYQKRPIYWLFDAGKQNGFKALIYLHRYTPDTIGKLRVDYLHRLQQVYASEIERMQDMMDNSKNQREVAVSAKRKEKLQKQLKECQEYDEKIAHLALARIKLDLDDGVKVNYEKAQTAADGKKYPVLGKL